VNELESTQVEERRSARERALELLYEAEIKGSTVDDVLAGLPVAPADLAVELVRGVEAHAGRIDEILTQRVSPRWTLARLAAVDRAVLRLGTYELLDRPDRTQAVIINEAVLLARRFGTDDSPRFVNGVLSAVAADARGSAPAAPPPADLLADPQVEALVIDLDGVIRQWDEGSRAEAEADLGLPLGAIEASAFDPARFEPAMTGEISFDGWCAAVGEAVAAEHGVAADAVAKVFADTRFDVDAEVLALVDRVHERVPVALLSNASSRLVEELRQAGLADHFDAVVGSADIGACKPDAAAFTAAAARLGVPPEQCLMVDDRLANVEGARAAGMQAIQFTGAEPLADALGEAGLL
jgi:putative hydrolase of the HAD superfamily